MIKCKFVLYLTFFMLCSCSSILGSTSETVVFSSHDEEDLYVEIIDSKNKIIDQGRTPLVTNLKKGRGYFKREHYQINAYTNDGSKYTKYLTPGISPTYFINIIVPGGQIGMVTIDPYSGAMWTFYDDEYVVDEVK